MKTRVGLKWQVVKWVLAIVVAVGFIGYWGISAVVADKLTVPQRSFNPQSNPGSFNLTYQDVRFPSHGGDAEIAGWFIPSPASQRVIVLVHGKDCSRTEEFYGRFPEFASKLHAGGFNVLMIDLRGHGQSSDAHFSFGLNEKRDVEGAVDWLVARGFKSGYIGVLGVSLGAASSIDATAEDTRIGALVEDSGYASFCPVLQKQWTSASGLPDFFMPSSLFMAQVMYGQDLCSSRPVDEISHIAPRPVLIIHSTGDQLVPMTNADQLKAAAPFAETHIVTGVEHARSYNADPDGYSQFVIEFFNKSLGK